MRQDGDDPPHLILAFGHTWDGIEPWEDMAVILKGTIDEPEGSMPAYSTGHHCRTCREGLTGERLGSVAESDEWLRQMLAAK
jgi:hypothetical protein